MLTDGNKDLIQTGFQYPASGPVTTPASFVNSIAGGKTADVISATIAARVRRTVPGAAASESGPSRPILTRSSPSRRTFM